MNAVDAVAAYLTDEQPNWQVYCIGFTTHQLVKKYFGPQVIVGVAENAAALAEKIIEDAGYVVRYERGTFQSGYCILEQKKVIVLNKFLQIEGRINVLIDILPNLTIYTEGFSAIQLKFYEELMINSLEEVKL
jgi:hypothetical protein